HERGTGVAGKVRLAVCGILAFALVGLAAAFSTSSPTQIVTSGSAAPGQDAAPVNDGQVQARLDQLGDPLPPGAIMRLGTARLRHEWGVAAVGFSTDGKHLVSAGGHMLRVWGAATGKGVRQH